jgi:hypothetical protein
VSGGAPSNITRCRTGCGCRVTVCRPVQVSQGISARTRFPRRPGLHPETAAHRGDAVLQPAQAGAPARVGPTDPVVHDFDAQSPVAARQGDPLRRRRARISRRSPGIATPRSRPRSRPARAALCRSRARGASPVRVPGPPAAAGHRHAGSVRRDGARGLPPPRCAAGTPGPPPAGRVPRACRRAFSIAIPAAAAAARTSPGLAPGRGSAPRAGGLRAPPPWPCTPAAQPRAGSARPAVRGNPTTGPALQGVPQLQRGIAKGTGERCLQLPGTSGRSSSTTRSPTALRARRADSSPQTKMTGRLICRTPCSPRPGTQTGRPGGGRGEGPHPVDERDDAHGDPERGQETPFGRRRPPEPQPDRQQEQQRQDGPRTLVEGRRRR